MKESLANDMRSLLTITTSGLLANDDVMDFVGTLMHAIFGMAFNNVIEHIYIQICSGML